MSCLSFTMGLLSNFLIAVQFLKQIPKYILQYIYTSPLSWWRHQMETFFAELAICATSKLRVTGLCAGNSPVNSPYKWPATRKMFPFDDVIMNFGTCHNLYAVMTWQLQNPKESVWCHQTVLLWHLQTFIVRNLQKPTSILKFFLKFLYIDYLLKKRNRLNCITAITLISIMTSSNGNIFQVTGHLCGEFTGPWWIPHTKASDAELWCFLWSASE